MIKNLVFKGGGVLGQAYTGAILELEKKGIIKDINRVAGTSAGSIAAFFLALGFTAKEIFDISSETNFKKFEDGKFFHKIGVVNNYGLHPGNTFLKWIQENMRKKGLNPNATFSDFKKAGFLDLHVFATNLNTQSLERFSWDSTPSVKVAYAVRASMSIPIFFDAVKIGKYMYVDGGCLYNYPITCFDVDCENLETLGLFIGDLLPEADNGLDYGSFPKYTKILFETILNAQNVNLNLDKEDVSRTIFIDNCGISPTNFSLTTEDKIKLFEAGRIGAQKFFEKKL